MVGRLVGNHMSIFDNKVKNASRAKRTVVVCLDGNGASERDALYKRLASAGKSSDGRVSKSPTKAILDEIKALEESLRDALLTVEIKSLTPDRWSEIKRQCPPGQDAVSKYLGFDQEKAVQQALLDSAEWVDGDEREKPTKEQWKILFSDPEHALGGGDWDRLAGAVIELNQASQAEAIARGKG